MGKADDTEVLDREADTEELDEGTEQTDDTEGAESEGDEGEQGTEGEADGEGSETDEVVITIGEESPSSEEDDGRAPEWVRELRKSNREKDRRIRELEAKVSTATPAPQAVVIGDKPTLAGCDYDEARLEREMDAWHTRKREADVQADKQRKDQETAQAAWQATQNAYGTAKAELKVKDFEDVEAVAREILSVTQQGLILMGLAPKRAATLVYALGKNPKKAREMAAIADPVKFAFAAAELETKLKVTPRKAAPLPERTVRGSGAVGSAVGGPDAVLAKLQAEADKTGDRTKVIAHIRKKNAQQRG